MHLLTDPFVVFLKLTDAAAQTVSLLLQILYFPQPLHVELAEILLLIIALFFSFQVSFFVLQVYT
jgi:hypothetical protein